MFGTKSLVTDKEYKLLKSKVFELIGEPTNNIYDDLYIFLNHQLEKVFEKIEQRGILSIDFKVKFIEIKKEIV